MIEPESTMSGLPSWDTNRQLVISTGVFPGLKSSIHSSEGSASVPIQPISLITTCPVVGSGLGVGVAVVDGVGAGVGDNTLITALMAGDSRGDSDGDSGDKVGVTMVVTMDFVGLGEPTDEPF